MSTNMRKTLYTKETKVPWDAPIRPPHRPSEAVLDSLYFIVNKLVKSLQACCCQAWQLNCLVNSYG